MTPKEVRALAQTDPLPDEWKGRKKVHEHVYHTLLGNPSKEYARKKLKRARQSRAAKNGYFCPGGKHKGIYKFNGRWYAYLHFARYE